ncbi:MAG: hypothetical protein GYA22_10210 [Bacteroidales bacterium]|nr:hypothetical protein [Bacteroidales bacterium]
MLTIFVAFWLAVFLALFTALIMYSSGSIQWLEHPMRQSAEAILQAAATRKQSSASLQKDKGYIAAGMQQAHAFLLRLQQVLGINMEEVEHLRDMVKKNKEDFTCRKCGSVFESKASKRRHEG